jgi:uncharacterized protein (TIGR03032 family)
MSQTGPTPADAAEAAQDIVPSLSFSPTFARWLLAQRLSLAFTSYQTGRLLLMGVGPDGRIAFSKQNYTRAMGLHYQAGTLYLASFFQVWRLENILDPGQYANRAYDAVFVPRIGHTTGYVDAHDLAVDRNGRVIFVNSRFSCLATLDPRQSFRPIWKPWFVSGLYPEDRCHLNGLAMEDGEARYVTTVSVSDETEGWRARPGDGGLLIDVQEDRIVAENLSMPHSPRVHDGAVWLLDSGRGFLVRIDPGTGAREEVAFCPGFGRGMAIHGNHAVIALSQARHGDFGELQLQRELETRDIEPWCGIIVVDLGNGRIIEHLRIDSGFTELFDVAVLPGFRNPMSVGVGSEEILRNVRFNPDFGPLNPD